jgi:ATP-binding protein involved in chromosome partitioning
MSDSCASSRPDPAQAAQEASIKVNLAHIKNKILVMSGKGGVGKSTVSVNIAKGLANRGFKTGLLDVDLHGPSVPRMLGLFGMATASQEAIIPMKVGDNLKVVSIEVLTDQKDQAVIWRGPLKIGVIRQFVADVEWGDLDYLVIDSPPGTGDEPLSVVQTIPDAKAVLVTTPQEISLADVRKSISFCKQVDLEMLGLVENMSGLICPHCGKSIDVFHSGGGLGLAELNEIPFLGAIPLDPQVVRSADDGKALVDLDDPENKAFAAYQGVVDRIVASTKEAAVH